MQGILYHCHGSEYGGHFVTFKSITSSSSGLLVSKLFKDTYDHISKCDACQRKNSISKINEMPQNPILEAEIFHTWITDFMGQDRFFSYLAYESGLKSFGVVVKE